MSQVFQTTDPVPTPSGWRERYDRMRGIEPPREITAGLKVFRGSHCRRRAELYHNAALEAGYASELEGMSGFAHVFVSERQTER